MGYIQVKRDGDVCTVRGRITPEHKVRTTPYHCTLICNEKEEEVTSVQCEGCAASKGGCKHAVAFLMWLHRRTEEPATTAVKCYWKKAALSNVGTSIKFIKAKDMGTEKLEALHEQNGNFLRKVVEYSKNNKTQIMNYFQEKTGVPSMSIHDLACDFKKRSNNVNVEDFLIFCSQKMSQKLCDEAEIATLNQAESKIWYELRYGRVTASKAHETAHCQTSDGSLVDAIMGAAKFKENFAMARGKALEEKVRARVGVIKKLNIKKCGLILNKNIPIMGASPDGIAGEYVIEIKCPEKQKNVKNYVNDSGLVMEKYYTQIQLQMHFANKPKGLFCIAAPNFESTNKVDIIEVLYDRNLCLDIIKQVETFWKMCIYKKVMLQ